MRILVGFLEKAHGLLGTGDDASPVVLAGCSSIHTFGMRYPIDVAFVSGEGVVLRSCRELWPNRLVSCRGSHLVVERPSSDEPWFEEGDVLGLAPGASQIGYGEEAPWVMT